MAADIFEDAERRMQKAVEALRQDLSTIRTGRASAALVDRIRSITMGLQLRSTRFARFPFQRRA